MWTAGGWSYSSRTLIVTHDNGRSSDRITEKLEGSQWITSERDSWSVDADPNGYSWIHQTWHDGTLTAEHHTEIWGPDGTTTTLDSTLIDGRLTSIEIRQAMLNGQELSMEVQEWRYGAPWSGERTSRDISATGAVMAVESSTWSAGAWVPDTRLIYRYDNDDVLRTVEHQLHTPSHGWVITDNPGLGWASWQFSPCPYVSLTMNNFTYLLFGYGTSLTDVAATRTELPQQSALQPNYPNPFNPTTTIPFSVAAGAYTTVAIFDVLGREVARPIDQWKDPGEYRVQFDAAGLASGMYICRFTSGNVTQTRKLMLVR